jgi:sugar O-acyltransferase (sialic acid O-acetyltransferase NeuD family)
MSEKRIAIIGAGGQAKVVVATAQALGRKIEGLYDDKAENAGKTILGEKVRGTISDLSQHEDLKELEVVVAIGSNTARKKVVDAHGFSFATLIHPDAVIHETAKVREGSVIFAGAVLQPDVLIGAHCIINTGATVDHDCYFGDFVHIAPGVHLAGDVTLEEGVFLGIGTVVIPGRRIGAWTTVGAGGAVVTSLANHVTAVGVPARILPDTQRE